MRPPGRLPLLAAALMFGFPTVAVALQTTIQRSSPTFDDVRDDLAAFDVDLQGFDDMGRVAPVTNVVLIREAGRLEFVDGVFVAMHPVAGRDAGLVFIGEGTFRLDPPLQIERDHLARFSERAAPEYSIPFTSAVLLFTDETLAELRDQGAQFGVAIPPRGTQDAANDARKYLVDDNTGEPDVALMQAFINRDRAGGEVFHAHFDPTTGRNRRLFYRVDASAEEEVSFGQEARGRGSRYETVSAFHRLDEYRDGEYVGDHGADDVAVEHYTIEAAIESNARFSAEVAMRVRMTEGGDFWTPFTLSRLLTVDSARWESGAAVQFGRGQDGGALWLRIPNDAEPGDVDTIQFWYHGSDLIDQTRDWYYLRSSSFWYPRSPGDHSTFDLTFHTPERLAIVSIGKRVEDSLEGDVRTTRWVTEFPAVHASFNTGVMTTSELRDPRIPVVELTINEQAHQTLSIQRSCRSGGPSLDIGRVRRDIEADIANSISFFQTWFGQPPITDLRVTEIPFAHGQAFPGMIHLSWMTYEGMGSEGYDEMFRAHEVAHQWWGLGVSPKTYHDTWLSEGFSEFSGLWYLNTVLEDPERYLERLRETKKRIFDRRHEAAPTWMGTRAFTNDARSDYQIMVYEKGAWVLHMLRNLFLDLETLDESRFVAMVRDFYQTNAGKRVSTEDFRKHAEQHAGFELRWFFDQWIYATAIPTYRVEYCGRDNEDGTYGVTARIEQEGVPDTFQMYVPIQLDFGQEGSARLRVGVAGPLTEVTLPPMPRRPDEIEFNAFESVLADVAEERWECRDEAEG